MRIKEYEISGRKFIQKPLVLGQLKQIIEIVSQIQVPGDMTPAGVVYMLMGRGLIPTALAVLLTEKGTRAHDKDLKALADFLTDECDYPTTLEVVESFFEQNKPDFVFKKIAELTGLIRESLGNGSKTSSPSSPGGTLPKEKQSSGESPATSASPI